SVISLSLRVSLHHRGGRLRWRTPWNRVIWKWFGCCCERARMSLTAWCVTACPAAVPFIAVLLSLPPHSVLWIVTGRQALGREGCGRPQRGAAATAAAVRRRCRRLRRREWVLSCPGCWPAEPEE